MKVKFVPQNIEIEIQPNQSVMNLAHENNLPVRSVCNGMPSCAECRIKLVNGEYNVPGPSRKELSLIGTGYFIDQRRLSCQLYCFGDITVDLTEQLEKAKEGEGSVPKKFLQRAKKDKAEDYHSVGGVLLEQDTALLKQAEQEAKQAPQRQENSGEHRPQQQQNRQQGRPQGQGGNRQGGGGGQQRQGGDSGDGQQRQGGGGRNRSRGGRGRGRR